MALVRNAQYSNLDGFSVKRHRDDVNEVDIELELAPDSEEEETLLESGGDVSGEITIELEDGSDIHKEFDFKLPPIPGATSQEELEEPEIEVDDEEEIEVESDPWKWELSKFFEWANEAKNRIPQHPGNEVGGCERAIAFLKRLGKEVRKATAMDVDGILDIHKLADIRNEIEDGIHALEKRIKDIESRNPKKNKKKKAEFEGGLVKEAKSGSFTVTVPLSISAIARACINGMVSGGHDIEVTFDKLAKKYKLSSLDRLQVKQLLADMNYPMPRWDRGMEDEEFDPTSSDNVDLAANYQS